MTDEKEPKLDPVQEELIRIARESAPRVAPLWMVMARYADEILDPLWKLVVIIASITVIINY